MLKKACENFRKSSYFSFLQNIRFHKTPAVRCVQRGFMLYLNICVIFQKEEAFTPMEQVKTFYRRYRGFFGGGLSWYFCRGRAVSARHHQHPAGGDDKLTLNRWMYDFQRMPFWQYALQDLQDRLRYFTLQEVRFFPFHYPERRRPAVLHQPDALPALHHCLYRGGGLPGQPGGRAVRQRDALALAGFALAMAAAPIWNEGMYSYYAVPQRALFWAMAAWLCLFGWAGDPPPPLGCAGRGAVLYRLRHL